MPDSVASKEWRGGLEGPSRNSHGFTNISALSVLKSKDKSTTVVVLKAKHEHVYCHRDLTPHHIGYAKEDNHNHLYACARRQKSTVKGLRWVPQ